MEWTQIQGMLLSDFFKIIFHKCLLKKNLPMVANSFLWQQPYFGMKSNIRDAMFLFLSYFPMKTVQFIHSPFTPEKQLDYLSTIPLKLPEFIAGPILLEHWVSSCNSDCICVVWFMYFPFVLQIVYTPWCLLYLENTLIRWMDVQSDLCFWSAYFNFFWDCLWW